MIGDNAASSSPLVPEAYDSSQPVFMQLNQGQPSQPLFPSTPPSLFSQAPSHHRRNPSDPPSSSQLLDSGTPTSQGGYVPDFLQSDSLQSTRQQDNISPLSRFSPGGDDRSPSVYSPPMSLQGGGSNNAFKPFPQSHSVTMGLSSLAQYGNLTPPSPLGPSSLSSSNPLGVSPLSRFGPSPYQPQQLSDFAVDSPVSELPIKISGPLSGPTNFNTPPGLQFGYTRPLSLSQTSSSNGTSTDLLSEQLSFMNLSGTSPFQHQQDGPRQRSESPGDRNGYGLPPHMMPTSRSMMQIAPHRSANIVVHTSGGTSFDGDNLGPSNIGTDDNLRMRSNMRQSSSVGALSSFMNPSFSTSSVNATVPPIASNTSATTPPFDIYARSFMPRSKPMTPDSFTNQRIPSPLNEVMSPPRVHGVMYRGAGGTANRRRHPSGTMYNFDGYGTGFAEGATRQTRGSLSSSPKNTSLPSAENAFGPNFNFEALSFDQLCENFMLIAMNQAGSRYLLSRLDACSFTDAERDRLFTEIKANLGALAYDPHGNYIMQKFFDIGTPEQKMFLFNNVVRGNVAPLSLHSAGCRVVQKALQCVGPEERAIMFHELDGLVLKCVMDQNGNHVIQKCIETAEPPESVQFVLDSFMGQAVLLARHAYGCRVLQRMIEHCTEAQVTPIVDELLVAVDSMLTDQYGNYVIQHVMESGIPAHKSKIVHATRGRVQELSCHKFASNVMEKCVQNCTTEERNDVIVSELLLNGGAPIFGLVSDQYGNYVVQKLIDICDPPTRDKILAVLRPAVSTLEQLCYGKHIIQCMAKYDPSLSMYLPTTQRSSSGTTSGSASPSASPTNTLASNPSSPSNVPVTTQNRRGGQQTRQKPHQQHSNGAVNGAQPFSFDGNNGRNRGQRYRASKQ